MRLLANEFLKLRTVRSPWLLFAAGPLLVVIGIAGVVAGGADITDPDTADKAVAHVGLMSLLALISGVMAVAGEYRNRTITDTYLATPRRGRVIAAKLAVHAIAGAVSGVVLALTALAATAVAFEAKGASVHWSDTNLWLTLAGGIGWNIAYAAVGVAVGALIRNPGAAIAASLAWIALIEGLLGQLVSDLARWLPFAAGQSLGRLPGAHLAQGTAALVLAGYVAALAAAALMTSVRRDVT
jgi:ABC-2 type transport system permease protein